MKVIDPELGEIMITEDVLESDETVTQDDQDIQDKIDLVTINH